MIQLGAQNSTVLPNLTSNAAVAPLANAYIADPTPPGGAVNLSAGGRPAGIYLLRLRAGNREIVRRVCLLK